MTRSLKAKLEKYETQLQDIRTNRANYMARLPAWQRPPSALSRGNQAILDKWDREEKKLQALIADAVLLDVEDILLKNNE